MACEICGSWYHNHWDCPRNKPGKAEKLKQPASKPFWHYDPQEAERKAYHEKEKQKVLKKEQEERTARYRELGEKW